MGIAAGPDGAMWFTSGNSIGRIQVVQETPATVGQCQKGGWRGFGIFRSQGACVQFVKQH